MEHDYRIEALASTFEKHAEEADIQHKHFIDMHKINYPDSPLPPHFEAEMFNISRALSVMAAEIEKCKHSLGIK